MKILFACNDDDTRQLYRIYLENTINDVVITEVSSAERAIELIKTNTYLAIIASDQIDSGGPEDIFCTLKEFAPSSIFVLFGHTSPEQYPTLDGYKAVNENNTSILMPLSPKDFQNKILKALSPSRSSLERVPAFQKVRLIHFYRFNKVLCNVYVKLSERKYVRVLNANTTYNKQDLDKYNHKDIEYFYITNNDFEKFQVTFTSHKYLEMDTNGLSPDESLDVMSSTHTVLQDLITKVGLSKQAVMLAEKNIENVTTLINKHPGLSTMFAKQLNSKNYLYDHGYLVAVVCCHIFNKLNWDTPENIQKLCAASILHDLCINNPKIGRIESRNDKDLKNFSKEDIDNFLNHPEQMAKIIMEANEFQKEVIDIVKYHHETPQGDGFYQIHPSRLSTICCTFLIAHYYVQRMYEFEFNPLEHNTVIREMKQLFYQYNFSTPMMSFEIQEGNNASLAA